MTFKAFVHKIHKKESSNTETIYLFGVLLLALVMLILVIHENIIEIKHNSTITLSLFFLGLLTILFTYFYQYYDFEKIKSEKKGFIEFDENELVINYDERIKYEDLSDFNLLIDAYYDEFINTYSRIPIERRSLGISNSITIIHKSKKRTFNFKLENKSHLKVLERNIYQVVINNKLKNIDGKKSIKLIPSQYTSLKEYKEYVGKQLKQKKINCTEGLLLIGYKNYEEAQELKKKYCL